MNKKFINRPLNPSVTMPDYTERNNAEVLAQRIKAFWKRQGYDVKMTLEDGPYSTSVRRAPVFIRSDMINGLPADLARKGR